MSFPAYGENKDSGVEWIGSIPVHWSVAPGRRLFSQKREPSLPDDEQLSATQKYGVLPQARFMELEDQKVTLALSGLENFKHVEADDFVISLRSFQGGIEHSPYTGCVSPAYTILRAREQFCPGFWKYALKSLGYIEALQSVTDGIRDGKNISYEQFGKVFVPEVPLEEQKAIAKFLDAETSKIDALVAEQRRLIELLSEKRQAVISHAVTKGLDPNVRMKPSGIEWLRDVPEHWTLQRVKYLTRILRGKFTHRPRNDPKMYNGPHPFIQTGEISPECRYVGEYHQTLSEEGYLISKQFPSGTLVMTITGAGTANVAILNYEACFPDSIVGFVPSPNVSVEYLYNLFVAMRDALLSTAVTNTQPNLNVERIGALLTVCPPLGEQIEIVNAIERESGEYNLLIDNAEQTIRLLHERRTALISATVTGKIDVREFVCQEAQ